MVNEKANRVDLKEAFRCLQEQMATRLGTNRKVITHPSTKGDASEINWITMLDTYLPKRYKVDKAFVLDHEGTLSDQIDVIIYDRHYSPFLFCQDDATYIPAESVYAVFEVKQELSRSTIQYSGTKAESVRRLKRTSVAIPHAGGEYEPKKPFGILSGILTLGCEWKGDWVKNVASSLDDLSDLQKLNLGCSLGCGGFEVEYKPETKIESSQRDDALIFFFLRLLSQLQKLGTIPAIDIAQYSKVLDSMEPITEVASPFPSDRQE